MYKLVFHKSVTKFLEKADKQIQIKAIKSFDTIAKNPINKLLDIKLLKGIESKDKHYRLRIGKYRFLYKVRKQEILIYFYKADNRGDTYK